MKIRLGRFIALLFVTAVLVVAGLVIYNGITHARVLGAVASGNVDRARRALNRRPDLITVQVMPQGSQRRGDTRVRWQGRYLMHQAVQNGSTEMAEMLVGYGADLGVRLEGESFLHVAAAAGDVPMMRWLTGKGADVNDRNTCGHPANALCTTGTYADYQPSDRPAAARTTCTGCANEGRTPLHAAQQFRADEGSTFLLSLGADPNAADAAGRTPLHAAAMAGASDGARILCMYGAAVTVRDRAGRTPEEAARAATVAGHTNEMVGWLRQGGGCAQLAAKARPGAPVSLEEMGMAWRAYLCETDPAHCEKAGK